MQYFCDVSDSEELLTLYYKKKEQIWHSYAPSERYILKMQLRKLLSEEQINEELLDKIWEKINYSGESYCFMDIIMIAFTENHYEHEFERNLALKRSDFKIVPLVCITSSTTKYWIDLIGRVYRSWGDYIENNTLPKGTIMAPKDGVVNYNYKNQVILIPYATPASLKTEWINTTASAVSFASECKYIIPSSKAVSKKIAAARLAADGMSALNAWGNISNRITHEQPIGIDNREARSDWCQLINGISNCVLSGASLFTDQNKTNNNFVDNLLTVAKVGSHLNSVEKAWHDFNNMEGATFSEKVKNTCTKMPTFEANNYPKRFFIEKYKLLMYSAENMTEVRRILDSEDIQKILPAGNELAVIDLAVAERKIEQKNLSGNQLCELPQKLRSIIFNIQMGKCENRTKILEVGIKILDKLSEEVTILFVKAVKIFYHQRLRDIEISFGRMLPFDEVLLRAFEFCTERYKSSEEMSNFVRNTKPKAIAQKLFIHFASLVGLYHEYE